MLKNFITTLTFLIFLIVVFANLAPAQDPQGRLITAVEVKGNKNISGATILSKLRVKTGEVFVQNIISQDIKRLYALGYFSDISVSTEDYKDGIKVIFKVFEKPIISEINIKGARRIRKDKLQEQIKIQPNSFLDESLLKLNLNEIKRLYVDRGFSFMEADYEISIDQTTNEAIINILIEENIQVRIKKITVKGNRAFSRKQILKLMITRMDGWFTSGFYRREVLEEDIKKIEDFYKNNGYLNAKLDYSTAFFGPGKQFMEINIEISEGKKNVVGKIDIEGNLVFPATEIKSQLSMLSGAVYSEEGLNQDLANIQGYYFEKGYIFAEVDPSASLDEETGRINIVYWIDAHEIAYVNKIRIRGNVKTKDKVIRRELRVYPGEAFDGGNLRRSKERLYNLGYFEEVDYELEPTDEARKRDLVVNVKEAKTGEFSFGAGFSSTERFVGFVEVAQKNFDLFNFPTFTGGGQDLRVRAQFGTTKKYYELSFTEPWFLDRPISFGVDGYDKRWDRSGTSGWGYDERRKGGDLRLGRRFGEYWTINTMYRMEEVTISGVSADASADFRNEEGANIVSSFWTDLTHDTRNNIFNPTRGRVLKGSVDIAGGPLGGDKDFIRYMASGAVYFTHFKHLVLELKLRAGIVDEFDDTETVPIYERFFAGGANTIRGFEERDVGPKDVSGESVGGEAMLIGNIEYTFPIFINYVKAAVFLDGGNVWQEAQDLGKGDIVCSAGLGFRVKTPLGPVRLDYGYPLKTETGQEKKGRFHFTMSRAF